jgi:hypothetical protein
MICGTASKLNVTKIYKRHQLLLRDHAITASDIEEAVMQFSSHDSG